jgi:hypothetical protein
LAATLSRRGKSLMPQDAIGAWLMEHPQPDMVWDEKSKQWLPRDKPDPRFASQQIHVLGSSTEKARQRDLDLASAQTVQPRESFAIRPPEIAYPGPSHVVSAGTGNRGTELADYLSAAPGAMSDAFGSITDALSGIGTSIGKTVSPYIGDAIFGSGAPPGAEARFGHGIEDADYRIDAMKNNNAAIREMLSHPVDGNFRPPQVPYTPHFPNYFETQPPAQPQPTAPPPVMPAPAINLAPDEFEIVDDAQEEQKEAPLQFGAVNLQPELPSGPDIKSQLAASPGALLAQLMAMGDAPTQASPEAMAPPLPRHKPQAPMAPPTPRAKPEVPLAPADPADEAYVPTGREPWRKPQRRSDVEQMVNPSGERRIAIHRDPNSGRIAGFSDGNKFVTLERDAASGRVIGLIERNLQNEQVA